MGRLVLSISLVILTTSCLSIHEHWSYSQANLTGICAELSKITRSDTLERRRQALDTLGFETTVYSDGQARISVLTRPDLTVVIPHEIAGSKKVPDQQASAKMWKSVTAHVSAMSMNAEQMHRKVDTIFLVEESKWASEAQFLQSILPGPSPLLVFSVETSLSASAMTESALDSHVNESEPSDIL